MAELYLPAGFMSIVQPFQHTLSGERWSVTYGIDHLIGSEQAMVDGLFTVTKSNLAALIDNQLTFLRTVGYYREEDGGPLAFVEATGVLAAGTDTNAKAPPNVCVSIKKRTGFVGRRYRGRMYFPGIVDESIADEVGVIATASLNSINSVFEAWFEDVETTVGSGGMVLLHAPWTEPPVDASPTPTKVTGLTCAPNVVTQRRRLP